jgi:hypothetical protein
VIPGAVPQAGGVPRTSAKDAARVAGIVLAAVGVLGFVPDVTTGVSAISFAGGSGTKLLGAFEVSVLLNVAYIGAGAAGIVLARTDRGARGFLTGGGIGFLVLWLVGVVKAGGWIPLNGADNWLHLALGAGLIAMGRLTARPAG